jgi:membrane-associated phospholipid phosphatase
LTAARPLGHGTGREIISLPFLAGSALPVSGYCQINCRSRFFKPLAKDSFPSDHAFVSTAI